MVMNAEAGMQGYVYKCKLLYVSIHAAGSCAAVPSHIVGRTSPSFLGPTTGPRPVFTIVSLCCLCVASFGVGVHVMYLKTRVFFSV
jgi:hypothetical protein